MKETKEEAERRRLQAINWLLSILVPGQTVYCIKHRPPTRKNSTGAPCHWRILAIDTVNPAEIVDITSKVARACGKRILGNGLLWTTDYSSEIISALSIALGYGPTSLKERTL